MLAELSLKTFIDKIISNDPVPGGGSVSALNGAMAASLAAMVANLTAGRKKYAEVVTPLKHITPHKLRSTYGTHLYQETGDIYLVADVLGHSDVNTTKKHYAAIDENRRRMARKAVKLREE